jgi:Subtilase family
MAGAIIRPTNQMGRVPFDSTGPIGTIGLMLIHADTLHATIAAQVAGAVLCLATSFGSPAAPQSLQRPTEHRSNEPTQSWWLRLSERGSDQQSSLRPPCHLTERALLRRALRRCAGGLYDERDRDIDHAALHRIASTGAEIRHVSRWLNAISVAADASQLARLRALECVIEVQPVARLGRVAPLPLSSNDPDGGIAGSFYGASEPQIVQLQLNLLHASGYTGSGVVVGVLDTGFRRTHAAFNVSSHVVSIVGEYDFVNDDPNAGPEPGDAPTQHDHGTYILGALGAYLPGTLVGAAYDASFLLAKAEDIAPDTAVEEDYFVAALEWLEANGADVATSSLAMFNVYGPDALDGITTAMSTAFAIAGQNGVHCFQGAGNSGHDADPSTNHLVIPADAFDVMAIGAVSSSGVITSFSSDGPTLDGRLKPELLARGASVWTVHPNNDTALASPSGTSLSTPLVAGVAACLVQAHPDWTPSQMRAALLSTASDYAGTGMPDPLFVRGFGIVRALDASGVTPPIADLNDDFIVDASDLAVVLGAWGPCTQPVGCIADLNHDGAVDATDLAVVLGDWSD